MTICPAIRARPHLGTGWWLGANVCLIALLTSTALLAAGSIASAATTFKTLYEFQEGKDGNGPNGPLIFDAAGSVYGTTANGGGSSCKFAGQVIGCGTVFKLTPPATGGDRWTETVLYRFTGGSDGAIPFGALVSDTTGILYGTASAGGNSGCPNSGSIGCGVVFKLTPPAMPGGAWIETVLHTFKGVNDGSNPNSSLVFDSSGALYGTTDGSDASGVCRAGCGTVFKLTPPAAKGGAWTETVLYNFAHDSGRGQSPSGVIFDAAGALYGTTFGGGNLASCNGEGCGTVFKLTPPGTKGGAWAKTTLYSFGGGSDGNGPGSLISDATGALYGTTTAGGDKAGCFGSGCGIVFKLASPTTTSGAWMESVLYRFTGGADGAQPSGALTSDAAGALYGAASDGGSCPVSGGCGTAFKLTPPTSAGRAWTDNTLHTFAGGGDGLLPRSLIFDAAGHLYGIAGGGGGSTTGCGGLGCGAVFELSGAGVALSRNPQRADFNADHKSDILLQNTNGAVSVWEMSGLKRVASGGPGNPGPAWRAIGTGYFFGSPYADILWQNLNGAVQVWQINQTKAAATATVGNPGTAWHAIATGDFNGDGKSDILLQNTNGAVEIWEMNGSKLVSSAVIGNPGTAWHVIGAGDFNGDGKSDILLQNTGGAVEIWEMDGLKVLASAMIGNPGTAWRAIGTGDFNRDGPADILLQNTNGAVEIWEMNGLKRIGVGAVGNPGAAWHVIGTGDYNGDGYSDILLQNANGAVQIWEMNGFKLVASAVIGNPGAAWHAIGG